MLTPGGLTLTLNTGGSNPGPTVQSRASTIRGTRIPNTLVPLFGLAIWIALLSWIVPTGRFDVIEADAHARIALDSSATKRRNRTPTTSFVDLDRFRTC